MCYGGRGVGRALFGSVDRAEVRPVGPYQRKYSRPYHTRPVGPRRPFIRQPRAGFQT